MTKTENNGMVCFLLWCVKRKSHFKLAHITKSLKTIPVKETGRQTTIKTMQSHSLGIWKSPKIFLVLYLLTLSY